MTYRAKALKIAVSQLGVKESPAGSNDGPMIHKYEAVTGMFRQAWCASFIQWCFLQAGFPQPLFNRSAYVPTIVNEARKLGWIVDRPAPGDLVCYDWEKDGLADHIGFIEVVNRDGSFRTVEGNTAIGNDSNGGEVMRRFRYPSQVKAFVRVPGDAPEPLAPMWAWFKWKDDGAPKGERPSNVPARVPARWWIRYKLHRGVRS